MDDEDLFFKVSISPNFQVFNFKKTKYHFFD